LDSTDIIFIGDNGNTPRTAQIADLNKAKGTVYQYGIHVPLIIAGPSVVNPGRASNALVNTADIFATILENFGYTNWRTQIPVNKPVDSKSMLPILRNTTDSVRAWSFCEIFRLTPDGTDGKAMRNRNYKLIRFDMNGTEKFFNLTNDPLENNNLLLGTLTATESANYTYLCNEMSALVGSISFCNPAFVATNDSKENILQNNILQNAVYPNPFTAHIYFKTDMSNQFFELTNALGQTVFSGQYIDKTDFSGLPKGVYFLKMKGETVKLIKA
jgi:hypothetical protein